MKGIEVKRGRIYLYGKLAGWLTEDESGFTFAYNQDYLKSNGAEAISLTLPLREEPYHDKVLFLF